MVNIWLTLVFACKTADQGFTTQTQDIYGDGGFASLSWGPDELVFEEITEGITYSLEINIQSTGDNTLKIDKVDITDSADGVFYVDTSATEDIYLDPGVDRDFIVIAQTTTAGVFLGEVRIKSNDSENRDVRIPLCGFPVEYEGERTCSSLLDETTDTGS